MLRTPNSVEELLVHGHTRQDRVHVVPADPAQRFQYYGTNTELSEVDEVLLNPPLYSGQDAVLLPKLHRLRIQDAEFDSILLIQLLEARHRASLADTPTTTAIMQVEID